MKIDVRAQGFALTDALNEYADGRLRLALKNAIDDVLQATVRLSDINGPRGGVDKRCSVHVVLKGRPDVVGEDTDADMYAAIDRAMDRVARGVERRTAQ